MFSGIGGFELGIKHAYELQQMGIKPQDSPDIEGGTPQYTERPLCIGYSEIDKYAIQIYERHFNHKNYGDATTINASELPDFDLLVGGFPCQAFSIAGKRGGLEDSRGTLFYDIARIAKEKRPQHLLLENVKGLLSHDNGRTFKLIISTFAELGYNLEWQVLNSKNFGVPQNRERVFIIGHLRECCGRQVFPLTGGSGEVISKEARQFQANTLTATAYKGAGNDGVTLITRQPLKFLERNGKNVDGDYSFTVDTANAGGVRVDSRIRRLTPTECERLQAYPDEWTEGVSDTQRYKTLGNGVTVNVVQYLIEKLYN